MFRGIMASVANLYVAESMEALNKQVTVPATKKAAMLIKTAPKLLENAERSLLEGDQEKSYVLFMKYLQLVQIIRNTKEYSADRKFFDAMLPANGFKEALKKSEELSLTLDKRYENKRVARDTKEMERMAAKMKVEEEKRAAEAKVTFRAMEPTQLYSLMSQKSTPFLLFDSRPSAEYKASHIAHTYSLNIPEEIIKAASIAKTIERDLHIQDRLQWARRNKVELLIFFDWNSEEFVSNTPLAYLRDALYKWDQGVEYKCQKPVLLKGGYENFALHYPMKVTDPKQSRLPARLRSSTGKGTTNTISVKDVEYPDDLLDNGFIKTPSPKPTVTPKSNSEDAVASGALVVSNGSVVTRRNGVGIFTKPTVPDRGAKPNFLLAPTKSDSSSSSDFAATSGLSDGSDVTNGAMNRAKLFDSGSSTAMNTATLNDAFNDDETSSIESLPPKAPKVDRSLKAKVLLKARESGGDRADKNLAEVLEAERELAEESVELEKRELMLEDKWEMLRLKREKEAEEDMRAEMAKNEEKLFDELKRVNEEKRLRDEENERLRRQLSEMRREMESQDSQAAEKMNVVIQERVEAAIKEKDAERLRIQAEVEEKRRARNRRRKKQQQQQQQEQEQEQAVEEKRRQFERLKDGPSSPASSNLNRSFSSPNIAEMLEEEDRKAAAKSTRGGAFPTPRFDRTNKPSALSNRGPRNFQPVWGMGKRGLTGLKNLGNTCYMNSVLQCLSNFTLPSQYFMDMAFQQALNENSETRGEVALEYAELVRALWSGQFKSISPVDLKRIVGKYRVAFAGYSQQDAHEFYSFLMDMLHNDVNEIKHKVKLPELEFDKMDENEGADRALNLDKLADKSFIRDTFYGQRKSSLQCLRCGYESPKYEAFHELILQLPAGNGKCTMRQLLANELKAETVEYSCPKCKREGHAHKKFEIIRLPLILTIQLKRFYQDDHGNWSKKQNFVDFDLSFDVGSFVRACGGKKNNYREFTLYGVSNHFGSMEGGHYTAYCYSQVYDKWHKYDDNEVSAMSPGNVKTSAAYILFYSAKN